MDTLYGAFGFPQSPKTRADLHALDMVRTKANNPMPYLIVER